MFKFSIANTEWTIKVIPQLDRRLLLDENICYGVTNYSDYTIYIADGLERQRFDHTIRHEITHAILYSSVYTKNNTEEPFISEEQLCDFMANWSRFIELRTSEAINLL